MAKASRNRKGSASPSQPFAGPAEIWRKFVAWAVETVDSSRSSALIRIGLVFVIWARFARAARPWDSDFGWPIAFSLLFFVATVARLIGYKARISTFVTGVLAISFYYFFGMVLGHEPYTHHHTYWIGIATLFCALTPCDKSYSLDRWLAVRRARKEGRRLPPEEGNVWGLRLIVVQLTMMYFWTAVDKLRSPSFLNGERLQGIFMSLYPHYGYWIESLWPFIVMAWIVVILELCLAFGMPFRATRRYLVIPGLLLHGLFFALLPVGTYSITIALLYLAYFDPNQIHRVIDELSGVPPSRMAFKPGT